MTEIIEPIIVCVEIGNSDGKLAPRAWKQFRGRTDTVIRYSCNQVFGIRHSKPSSGYVNACWHFSIDPGEIETLKEDLSITAAIYLQDSIAWSQIAQTEFITPDVNP